MIDVRQLFGMRAVMPESQIDLVVEFEPWDSEKFYDRLGIEDRFIDILGKQVACVTVPIRPGRNLGQHRGGGGAEQIVTGGMATMPPRSWPGRWISGRIWAVSPADRG